MQRGFGHFERRKQITLKQMEQVEHIQDEARGRHEEGLGASGGRSLPLCFPDVPFF